MLPEVIDWDELQNFLREYDTVFVLGHLKKPMSIKALALLEDYARRTPGARFLQYDSGSERGIKLNGKLDVKFCPKLMAFKDGVEVKSYIGDNPTEIEAVLNSIATVEVMNEPQDWAKLVQYDEPASSVSAV